MNYWLLLIPIISACLGWFTHRMAIRMLFHPRESKSIFGIRIQGIFPGRKQQFAEKLGKMVSSELFSISEISGKIVDPRNLDLILPHIDAHIEQFLKVKLKESMPMISMFIGDKTINQLKELFLEELKTLFPVIMEKYMISLQEKLDLEKIVADKIRSFSNDKIEDLIRQSLAKELRYIQILGAVLGFIIGLLSVTLTLVF